MIDLSFTPVKKEEKTNNYLKIYNMYNQISTLK